MQVCPVVHKRRCRLFSLPACWLSASKNALPSPISNFLNISLHKSLYEDQQTLQSFYSESLQMERSAGTRVLPPMELNGMSLRACMLSLRSIAITIMIHNDHFHFPCDKTDRAIRDRCSLNDSQVRIDCNNGTFNFHIILMGHLIFISYILFGSTYFDFESNF